jgi:ribosome-associated heat shock protein Hsp15
MADRLNAPQQRLDQWLWFARILKSRTLAAELVGRGKVRVNRVRVVKPSHLLREGDVLTIALRGEVRLIQVLAIGERRGPPQEARQLYRPMGDATGPSPDRDTPAGIDPSFSKAGQAQSRKLRP